MPEVSVIFISYNQRSYVAQALASILDQAYDDFEVIVADDGSSDGGSELIDEVLRFHPRSGLARRLMSTGNVGLVANWNRAVEAARGKILVTQAGDDISRADRLAVIVRNFYDDDRVMAVFSQVSIIDEHGKLIRQAFETLRPTGETHHYQGTLDGFSFWQGAPVLGACGAYRAPVARQFPPIRHAVSEDQPYVYRALLLGGVRYAPETLVQWRWHGANLSLGALVDETDRRASLKRRAKLHYDREQAMELHLSDARHALEAGIIDALRFEKEHVRIKARRNVERLGGLSIDPDTSMKAWISCARDMLASHGFSIRALRYALTCLIRFALPSALKLKSSRAK